MRHLLTVFLLFMHVSLLAQIQGPPTTCIYEQVSYTSEVLLGVRWSLSGGGYISGPDNQWKVNIVWNTVGAFQIKLTYSSGGSVITKTKNVQVVERPVAGTASGGTSFCVSGSGTISLTGYLYGSVQWQQRDGSGSWFNIPGATASTYNYNGITTTSYYRAGVRNNICTDTVYSNVVTIQINPAPQDGSIGADKSIVCLGQSVNIYTSGGVGSPNYWCSTDGGQNWNIFANAYNGQSAFVYTPNATGTYRFHLRNSTICGFCWDAGNGGCPTYAYVDVVVIAPPIGGEAKSVASNQVSNTVYSSAFGATKLEGHAGSVQEWQYSFSETGAFTSWGQAGMTTTSSTCCINAPEQTVWIRAIVMNDGCSVPSSPATYYWQSTPPVVAVGTNQVVSTETASVTLTATVSAGNGTVTNLGWTKISGPSITMSGADSPTLTLTDFVVGSYLFRYRATDQFGYIGSDDVLLTVVWPNNYNYIKETVVAIPGVTPSTLSSVQDRNLNVTYTYFDALGREAERVTKKGSPLQRDFVQPTVFDDFGRERRKYLPYVSAEGNGYYKIIDFTDAGDYTHNFYDEADDKIANDNRPFSEVIFDGTPLKRPLKEYGAGEVWASHAENRFVTYHIAVNIFDPAHSQHEEIIAWTINADNVPVRRTPTAGHIASGGYYTTGQLDIKSVKDEQGNEIRTYVDKEGRTILKKIQTVNAPSLNNADHWAQTYYIYDALDNLVVVLPHEAVKEFLNH